MKTATVRDLRNHYSKLLEWLDAGEEILITQRGKSIARLIPEPSCTPRPVDWSLSAAVTRDRSAEPILTATQSAQLITEAGGKW
jgi:prevent-host-death family protein